MVLPTPRLMEMTNSPGDRLSSLQRGSSLKRLLFVTAVGGGAGIAVGIRLLLNLALTVPHTGDSPGATLTAASGLVVLAVAVLMVWIGYRATIHDLAPPFWATASIGLGAFALGILTGLD